MLNKQTDNTIYFFTSQAKRCKLSERVITSSLLANLSYQMIGKANDPDSVRYYKNISEEIEKRTVSRSFTNSVIGGDSRTSEGTRETSKYKNQDFTRLKQGQFFVFADGKDKLYNFDLFPFKRLE